ncbi:MAG: S8 family serine peptidase [Odoribacteraceae bacterium]|jgi:thioredoxin|nr:S8 family serine peptidase [Odoribacteraceae bacterium]
MTRIGIAALLLWLAGPVASAQERADWYNCSPETGVFGAGVDEAYRLLQGKKVKARPIVALITGGVKVTHEALAPVIWQNPGEKPDGKDNDKNGLVDDLHGWNFIGGKDGKTMSRMTREGDREFLRLKERYGDLVTDGQRFFKYVDDERQEVPPPTDLAEYRYYRERVMPESSLARDYGGVTLARLLREYARRFDQELKTRYPGRPDFTYAEFLSLAGSRQDSLRGIALTVMQYYFYIRKESHWSGVLAYYGGNDYVNSTRHSFEQEWRQTGDDRRAVVGDNPLDLQDRRHGNPVVDAPAPLAGTFMAGIIAGERGKPGRNNPIAEQARIMPLVVSTGDGEPYLKDLALAIRYAVDKQASVIVLPLQNSLYPPEQARWISDALRHAEEKGVLVIAPAWEIARDLSRETFYPNRWMAGGDELTNLMIVSASGKEGKPAWEANHGAREVDIFAPGADLLSTGVDAGYAVASGSSLAAAAVAGTAALLKSYYPGLTGPRLREILLATATRRPGVEIEKGVEIEGHPSRDLFLFEQLALSGGIVNAAAAVRQLEGLPPVVRQEPPSRVENTSAEVIDYREVDGKIILPFLVNGVPVELALDLAGHAAILPEYAGTLKIDTLDAGEFAGYSSFLHKPVATGRIVKLASVSLGNAIFGSDLPAFLLADEPYLRELGVAGVINGSVFQNVVFTLDSRRKKITLSIPYRPPYMRLDHRAGIDVGPGASVTVEAGIDGKPFPLLLDTWSGGMLHLPPADFDRLQAPAGGTGTIERGYERPAPAPAVKELPALTLVNSTLRGVPVVKDSTIRHPALGNGILDHGLLSVDYARRKLYFQPFDLVPVEDAVARASERVEPGKLNPITKEYFLKHVHDYRANKEFTFKGDKPVVIDFWATWCAPCMEMLPAMERMAAKYKDEVLFLKVNADIEKELCNVFDIQSLPTLLFIPVGGKPIVEVGALPARYEEIIREKLLNKD